MVARTQSQRGGEPCEYCGEWRYRDGSHETIDAAERCHTDQLVVKLRRENAALQAENDRLLEKCNRLHEERDHYREIAHRAGVGLPESSCES